MPWQEYPGITGGGGTTLALAADAIRRLDEIRLLIEMEQDNRLIAVTERYSGDRRGYELR